MNLTEIRTRVERSHAAARRNETLAAAQLDQCKTEVAMLAGQLVLLGELEAEAAKETPSADVPASN